MARGGDPQPPFGHAVFELKPEVGQSRDADEASVPDGWLSEYDGLESSRQLDRLVGDVELMAALALRRFEGPEWEQFALELVKYGRSVIHSWIRRGLIFQKCKDRGYRLPPYPAELVLDRDAADAMADETIAIAIVKFRETVLLAKRWNPSLNASIKTFFVGQALLRFNNVYRRWLREETDRLRDRPTPDDVLMLRAEIPSATFDAPGGALIAADDLREHLDAARDDRTRSVLLLRAFDMSNAQVGEHLGISESAVEGVLYRYVKRVEKRRTA